MLSASPFSSSETAVPLPTNPRWQKSSSITRRKPRKFVSKKPAILILIVLAILIQGCASFVSISRSSTPVPDKASSVALEGATKDAPESVGEIKDAPNDLSAPPPQRYSDQGKRAKPQLAVPLQSILIETSLPLPEPTSTLEPTATPTRVIVDTPTFTPTPSPTATSLPTDTPTPIPSATPTPTPTPQLGIKYVVIISIDGLRPDALELADTPTLDKLKSKGAYCPTAQTVVQSCTLPGHASMLTGVLPEKHGLLWSLPYMGWPGLNGPTLFNVAHDAGLSTAMVFGKEKLNYLVLPNSVDKLFGVDAHDPEIKDEAVELIQEGLPDVLFVHFPDVDRVGHAIGWMSDHQLYAVTFVDGLIGEIVTALESGGYLNNTLLIITADHGGHGLGHGDDSPLDRTIPWLAVGPGVPSGITLGDIDIYDTASTVLYALELPIPEGWDGRPVLEIFQPIDE